MWRATVLMLVMIPLLETIAKAQQPDTTRSEVTDDLEQALDNFDPEDPESAGDQLAHYLQELAASPVNINRAEIDELLQVPGLNLEMGREIIRQRTEVKPFETVNELLDIKGIGNRTLEQIRPYVTVGSRAELRRTLYTNYRYWINESRFEAFSRVQQTLQQQEGYRRQDSSGYLGSPLKYYQRLRYNSRHISANLTQEKDPGEMLRNPAGFDHNSWHFALTDNGSLKTFVAGDYNLSFGQGLVLWNGGAFGKGREVTGSVSRNERGIRPYTSSGEANFFRGAAAAYGNKIQFTGFYAKQNREASVVNGDTIRFPNETGMHRTLTEIGRKGNISQEIYGGRIRSELPFGFVGATGYRVAFSNYIVPGSGVYNRYDFSGQENIVAGIDYKFLLGNNILFGEAARSQNGGFGLVAGVESTVNRNTDAVIAYRNYQKDFHSPFGSGFGEQSGEPQNEEGFYLGVSHELNPNIRLSAYFDQFRFPAPRFGTTQPTKGFDWIGLLEVRLNRDLEFYMQARSEVVDDEYEFTDETGRLQRKLGKTYRSGLRMHLSYEVNKSIRLRSRFELVQTRQPLESVERGYLIYQDLRFRAGHRWTFDGRITMFDTDGYNSRVYQFENDLLYAFSNTVLFDQGQRFYLLVNCEPLSFMEIWAKFGITIYENRQIISSGLNEIKGNRKSDVGFQVRFRM